MLRPFALFALLAVSVLPPAARAADWTLLRGNDQVKLSIDKSSIRRKGDAASFRYLVDHARPQGDFKTAIYRSLVVNATIRCKARTMAMGASEAFAGPQARGVSLGVAAPDKDDARFRPIEKDSSDEDLWAAVCAPPAKRKGG